MEVDYCRIPSNQEQNKIQSPRPRPCPHQNFSSAGDASICRRLIAGIRARSPHRRKKSRERGKRPRREREREMITRHNLAEQLREYQIRSKHDWATASFFSSTTSYTSRRAADKVTSRALRNIPKQPSPQFRYHIMLNLCGFLITAHMRHGYASVTGIAIPPMRPAKLGKNGRATEMKKAKHPNNTRIAVLSHLGHGLFMVLMYRNSRLSKTGMAYIWNELRLLMTTRRLVIPSRNFGILCPWYSFKALSIPPFAANP
ncbi:hypothetical protein AKJ16_DCAP04526 [Drosera capensis]